MPQMSNLDWFILSFYFISIYILLIMLINFLNYGFFLIKDFFNWEGNLKLLNNNFNLIW